MPYRVKTVTTPLWADHQRTSKKGKVAARVEFKALEVVTDGGLDMAKVDGVPYMRQSDDGLTSGDGWIELKNCEKVVADAPPGGGAVPVVLKAGRYRISGEVTVEEIAD